MALGDKAEGPDKSATAPPWRTAFRRTITDETLTISLIAIILGVLVGWAVIGFRELIDLFQWIAFGSADERLATVARGLDWWHVLLVPAVGGLVVGLFFRFLVPGNAPAGPAQVIECSAVTGGRMSLLRGLMATVASALSIGAGASVGREGPAVLLGASISAWFAERLDYQRSRSRVLLGCGAAAAVAASFNAPLAGALFAHELVLGHYALRAFAPVVMSSIAATLVSREYYGDFPAFIVPVVEAIHWIEFPAFILTGIICGLVATLMMGAIVFCADRFSAIPFPSWLKPGIAGLFVGVIALQFPEVLGVGYEVTDQALQGDVVLSLLLMLIAAKIVATGLSLGGGFGGGVFSPSLALGALTGAAVGAIATSISPELSSGIGAYALIGMGAVSAAVLGAPISTTLIIFELTSNYTLTVAVMVAVVFAVVISQNLTGRKSFFLWQLERNGLVLDGGHDVSVLRSLRVKDVADDTVTRCSPDTPVWRVEQLVARGPGAMVFVTEGEGQLLGTVTPQQLAGLEEDDSKDIPASEVMREPVAVLAPSDTLDDALAAFRTSEEETLPVVEQLEKSRLVGQVRAAKVLTRYNMALLETQAEERGRLVRM